MKTLSVQSVVCEVKGKAEVHDTWRGLRAALDECRKGDLIVVNYFDAQHNLREAQGSLSSKDGKHYVKAHEGQSGCLNAGRGSGQRAIVYEVY